VRRRLTAPSPAAAAAARRTNFIGSGVDFIVGGGRVLLYNTCDFVAARGCRSASARIPLWHCHFLSIIKMVCHLLHLKKNVTLQYYSYTLKTNKQFRKQFIKL
jgi:hypothetical protein